jgi:hypothetical protein
LLNKIIIIIIIIGFFDFFILDLQIEIVLGKSEKFDSLMSAATTTTSAPEAAAVEDKE